MSTPLTNIFGTKILCFFIFSIFAQEKIPIGTLSTQMSPLAPFLIFVGPSLWPPNLCGPIFVVS